MDTMLQTCARLQNVPINRRHSRKLILNIVKEKFFISIAFSKPGYLHITDLVCEVITIPVFRHRKDCFHYYAWHCRSLSHFEMERLLKWSTGLGFTSGIICLSDNPSNLWVFLVRCSINTLNSLENYFLPNACK